MAIWDDAGLSDGGKLSQPVQNSLWHDARKIQRKEKSLTPSKRIRVDGGLFMLDVSFSKFPRRTGISFSEGLRKIISRTKATGLPNLGDALFRIQQLMVREGKLRSLLSAGQGLIRNGCRGHLHRGLPFHDPETGKTGRRPSPRRRGRRAMHLCL